MSLNVSALADFNNQVAGEVLAKMVYGGSTIEYATVKEGIKHQEPINLFETNLYIQNSTCSTTYSGSLVASQRNITVTPRVSQDGICLRDMDKKYLGVAFLEPGSYNESFQLATAYSDMLVNQFQKSNDQFLWNTTDGLGLLTSGSTAGVVVGAGAATGSVSTANMLSIIDSMVEQASSDIADRDDLTVFMSVTNFKKYVNALRSANNYWFDPASISNRRSIVEMAYPFHNLKVVGTVGLQGSDRITLLPAKQIVVGTDLLSDFSDFQLWYSLDNDQLRHRIATKLGVQIAYPEYVITNDKN